MSIGIQEPVNEITKVGVALNKGFALGDTVIYMPFFAMLGAMAVTVYWPIISLSTLFFAKGTPSYGFTNITSYSITLTLIAL